MKPRILTYDWDRYDFGNTVRGMVNVDDLCTLAGEDFGVGSTVTRETDQSSVLHKRFYAGFADAMRDQYQRFVAAIATEVLGDVEVYYQATPTFRVQFPDNMAVGEFHTDAEYGHQDGAVNVWVPLTPAFHTNTIWIEGYPWQLAPGEVLIFDGVHSLHGNKMNTTRCSRVSFDLRMLPASSFVETGRRSVNTHMPLALGHYYARTGGA